MKRKNKRLSLIAIFALACTFSATVFAGCGGEHVHSYTEWGSNATQHWKECKDGAVDESTRTDHVFIAGECECGAKEQTGPTEEDKYGAVTGSVRLYKYGEYVTDALSGVQVDMGDDDVEISGSVKDGKYTFNVENVKVGKLYELTITRAGYQSYTTEILLDEEGEKPNIGGDNGITLNYEVFGILEGYDAQYHDLTHVNDADPYIVFAENPGGKTLNVLTNDKYGDVSATLRVKFNNSGHSFHTQGIILKFEDGKHLIVRYHNGDQVNGNIQYCDAAWASTPKENTLFGDDAQLNQYGENAIHTLLNAETAAIKADGLDLTVILNDGALYTFFAGNFVAKYGLPEGYADKKVQIAYFAWDAASNARFDYDITEEIPALQSAIDIDVTNPADGTVCTVTATPQKEVYELGEQVELTFAAPEGYKLDALTVGGVDRINDVVGGKLTVKADKIELNIAAAFVKEEPIALDLTVKGKKLGTTAALADGTTVTFKNTDYTFTVAGGKITAPSVVKGRYIVKVAGYYEKEIVLDEQLTEVTLEYEMLLSSAGDRGGVDLSQMNEQGGKIIAVGNTLNVNVTTAASYTVVQATAKFDILDDYADKQRRYGIYLKFGDDKNLRVDLDLHENGNNYVLQETNWSTMQGFNWGWVKTYTDAEVSAFVQNGFTYTLVRNAEKVLIICNGEHIRTYILPDAYKDVGAYVGFIMDGNNSDGTKGFTYSVSDSISDVAITDETDNEYGSLTFTPEAVKLGDTVTVTVTPVQGYMFDSLTVTGATVTPAGNNAYTFVAVLPSHTVTATFKDIPAQKAELALSAIGLNSAAISLDGERVTLTPATGMPVELVVENGKIGGYLATGSYTLTLGGYYSAEVEVNADGVFTQTELTLIKKIFEFNGIRETESNLKTDDENLPNVADSTGAATNGKISVKGEGKIYEWSVDEYDDVAVSFTFKNVSDKERGITLLVAHQRTVAVRFQKDGDNGAKLQWYGDWFGGWFWGTQSVVESFEFGGGTAYLNPLDSDLLNKYNGDGLKVTLLRKGEMVYAIVDGKLYSAVLLGQYANSKIKVGIFDQKTTGTYDIPFTIDTDVDAILQAALQSENKVLSVLGNWTVTDTTLAVTGNGFAEIYNRAETYKESLEITIAAQNSGAEKKQQGILYRFENGDWFSFRFEQSYLQYSESAYISTLSTRSNGYNRGILKNWALIKDFSAEQTTLFNGDGIALKLVRSGNDFVIILGDTVVDSFSLDAKYADMKGTAAVVVENGSGKAFAYEYKSGDAALAGLSAVTVSFDGDNKNYTASVDKKYAFAGDEVKITVNSAFSSWSFVPVSIKINGEEKLSDFTRTSVEAGLAKYELTVAVTADTQVVVTVGADTTVEYRASVNNVEYGTVKCDMELAETPSTVYYWNDNCTLTITANDGYALEKLVIGEVEITEGWTENNGVYTYSFKVTGDINAVAHFAAAQTQPETQPDEQQ